MAPHADQEVAGFWLYFCGISLTGRNQVSPPEAPGSAHTEVWVS